MVVILMFLAVKGHLQQGWGFLKVISHRGICLPLTFHLAETQLCDTRNGFLVHPMAIPINICGSYTEQNMP